MKRTPASKLPAQRAFVARMASLADAPVAPGCPLPRRREEFLPGKAWGLWFTCRVLSKENY